MEGRETTLGSEAHVVGTLYEQPPNKESALVEPILVDERAIATRHRRTDAERLHLYVPIEDIQAFTNTYTPQAPHVYSKTHKRLLMAYFGQCTKSATDEQAAALALQFEAFAHIRFAHILTPRDSAMLQLLRRNITEGKSWQELNTEYPENISDVALRSSVRYTMLKLRHLLPDGADDLFFAHVQKHIKSPAELYTPALDRQARKSQQSKLSRNRISGDREAKASSLAYYLRELGRFELLTKEDERTLAQAIEDGKQAREKLISEESLSEPDRQQLIMRSQEGSAAKERFIQANLRLVVHVAKRFGQKQPLPFEDLVQEGNLGLEHAITKYDWRKGYRFSTYAYPWIHMYISRALYGTGSTIHIPVRTAGRLARELRQNPDVGKLPDDLREIYELSSPTSLHKPITDTSGELQDVIAAPTGTPETICIDTMQQSIIRSALECLTEAQREVVFYRFGFIDGVKKTFKEISTVLGMSHPSIRQLYNTSMERLAEHLKGADFFDDYGA